MLYLSMQYEHVPSSHTITQAPTHMHQYDRTYKRTLTLTQMLKLVHPSTRSHTHTHAHTHPHTRTCERVSKKVRCKTKINISGDRNFCNEGSTCYEKRRKRSKVGIKIGGVGVGKGVVVLPTQLSKRKKMNVWLTQKGIGQKSQTGDKLLGTNKGFDVR